MQSRGKGIEGTGQGKQMVGQGKQVKDKQARFTGVRCNGKTLRQHNLIYQEAH